MKKTQFKVANLTLIRDRCLNQSAQIKSETENFIPPFPYTHGETLEKDRAVKLQQFRAEAIQKIDQMKLKRDLEIGNRSKDHLIA